MFFGAQDDDDDDFIPSSSSSKLSSLFGGNPGSKSSNLKYVAPKQPRPDRADSTGRDGAGGGGTPSPGDQAAAGGNKQAPAVLIAVPVQAYLYVNQVAQGQGQAMCCVLGDANAANFQFLVYRSKQDHLTRARITQQFSITVQANHYATFLDDQLRSWSVLLEPGHYVDLLTQIGICRAMVERSGGKGDGSVVATQDVGLGEGPGLKEGDQAQLSVTSWSVTPAGKKGEQVEEKKSDQRVKFKDLGSSWMVGLLGGQKNSRRLVFTHRTKDGGGGLVMHDVTVTKVRQRAGGGSGGEQSGRSTPLVETTPLPPPTVMDNMAVSPASEALPEEPAAEPPRSRPTPSSRAHLVSRVARVGHQLFPTQLAHPAPHVPPTDSESEAEEVSRTRGRGRSVSGGATEEVAATPAMSRPPLHHPSTSPRPLPPHHPHPHQQMVVYQSAFRPHPNAMPGEYVSAAVAPQPAPPLAPPAPDPTLSLLFSETRSQNTDVKISMARMSDRIDTLVSKIEKMDQQQQQHQQHQHMAVAGQPGLGMGTGGMMMMPQYSNPALAFAPVQTDPQGLLSQVTALVKENESMKARLEEREGKLATLNDSLTQLLQKNQKLLEEKTSMLEAQGAGIGAGSEVAGLREERAKLAGQLSLTSHQLDTLREELSQSKERIQAREREVEELKTQVQAQHSTRQDDHTAKETLSKEKNQLQGKLDHALQESEAARKDREEARKESEEAKKEKEEIRKESEKAKREEEKAVREVKEAKKELEIIMGGKQGLEEKQAGLVREVETAQAENQNLTRKVAELEQQVEVMRQQLKEVGDKNREKETQQDQAATDQVNTAQVKQLETEVARLTAWCSQLEQDKTEACSQLQEQLRTLTREKSQVEARLQAVESDTQGCTNNNPEDMVATVKRVMNNVYRVLKSQFSPGQTYDGQEVLQSLLVVIRETTLSMMEELEKNNTEDNKKAAGMDRGSEKEAVKRVGEGTRLSPESTDKAKTKSGEAMVQVATSEGALPENNAVQDSPTTLHNSGSPEGESGIKAPTASVQCSPQQHPVSSASQNSHDSQEVEGSTFFSAGMDHECKIGGNKSTIENMDVQSLENKDAESVESTKNKDAESVEFTKNKDAESVESTKNKDAESVESTKNKDAESVESTKNKDAESVESTKNKDAESVESTKNKDAESVDSTKNKDAESVEFTENKDAESVESTKNKGAESVESTESKEKDNVESKVEEIVSKEPAIDLSNTRTTACEKSDSSRDSSLERGWRPQPPTPPLFSDEEDDDSDWLS